MKEIQIGGKLRPINFGMSTLADFCEIKGVSLRNMEKAFADMSLKDSIILMHLALRAGAARMRLSEDITLQDVQDWIDDDISAFAAGMEAFSASQDVQEKNGKSRAALKK
jgi:serine kinase of HPr protein (carbohydrate metabolism regulator)